MSKEVIKHILSKSKLTGKEVGTLSILSTIAQINAVKGDNKQTYPMLTNFALQRAIDKIRGDADQVEIFNSYVGLESLASHLYTLLLAYTQQIENGFNKLLLGLALDFWKADKEETKNNLPLIMTEDKYKKELKASNKKFKEGKVSYYDLLYIGLCDIRTLPIENNPVYELYKSYAQLPAQDKTLIELYKERYIHKLEGYYTLAGGRSSEEVTLEEYIEDFFNRPLMKCMPAKEKKELKDYYFNEHAGCLGECGILTLWNKVKSEEEKDKTKDFIKTLNEVATLRTPEGKATYMRVREFIALVRQHFILKEDTEAFIKELDQLEADSFILTETITKQDFIENCKFIYYHFKEDEDNARIMDLYLKELPELRDILNKDITDRVGIKEADYTITTKAGKITEYFKPLITWEDLYNKNIYNVKENAYWYFLYKSGDLARNNGIAIAQENSLTDEYKEEHFKEGVYSYKTSFAKYIDAFKDMGFSRTSKDDNKMIIKKYIEDGFRNAYAILALLEDVEEIHEIEGFKDAYSIEITRLEAGMIAFNFFKWNFIDKANTANNKTALLKLEEDINYINFEEFKPSKEVRQRAREVIKNIKEFKGGGHKVNKFLALYFNSENTFTNTEGLKNV